MRFTTSAPDYTLRALAQVSSVDSVRVIYGSTEFTCAPHDAPAILRTLKDQGYDVFAGHFKEHGIAPAPRAIPATSAIVKR